GAGIGDISSDNTTKYYFDYDDNVNNTVTYGKLYTWAAVMNGAASSDVIQSGVQGACPDGWHVPSDAEWKELEMHLGMSQSNADDIGNRGTDEGEKLKEIGETHWVTNNNATNESGFTALPGGCRYDTGSFNSLGYSAYFWTTTENSTYTAWYRKLGFDYSSITRYAKEKESGHSVRCIKD
ncbi:MAG: fibrobacter succinogenes major paralogous domain-containing protein, partial [Candidatus Delongbacteria bacterium]|nr:fibrobacter succinogenes major paralogous domain-containing protein [Candidatus Delongbacteria bacterium]